jgi:WD40 repeat protein
MFESSNNSSNSQKKRNCSEHGLTCIAWNDCPFEPAKIAVGGYSKIARVLSLERNTLKEVWCFSFSFQSVTDLQLMVCVFFLQECELGEHSSPVQDIAWAPAMGRSFHLIATASRESSFKVWNLLFQMYH